jgi:hypothetical protein
MKTVKLPPVTAKGKTVSRKDQRAASIGGGRGGRDSQGPGHPSRPREQEFTRPPHREMWHQTLHKPRKYLKKMQEAERKAAAEKKPKTDK